MGEGHRNEASMLDNYEASLYKSSFYVGNECP